jgi:type II secretory pathway component PulK
MVTLLATSISAFAKSADVKPDDAAAATNATQRTDCNRTANDAAKQDKQKSSDKQNSNDNQQIEQQDQQWDHDLQGDYGG